MTSSYRPSHSNRGYRYAVEDCAVRAEDLAHFRAKRDEWMDWLHFDGEHAIVGAMTDMLWSDAVFRLVNETRRHAIAAGGAFATLNGDIARLIDSGYVHQQLTTIRRLTEPTATRPERQIISLRRLIDDVRAHRHLITREVFVGWDGLPVDYEDVKHADIAEWSRQGGGVRFGETQGPEAWGMAELQHEIFDDLSGVAPDGRQRGDRIAETAFDAIEALLTAAPFVTVIRFLNKMIAHAADPRSRGGRPIEGPALADIWACHKALVQAMGRISDLFHGEARASVPTPQYDILKHWAAPFAPDSAFEAIGEQWRRENADRMHWTRDVE